MKRVNVRQLQAHTGSIVEFAAKGRVVVVVKRGRPIAELRPIGDTRQRRALPDRTALLRRYPTLRADSGRFLEEGRS